MDYLFSSSQQPEDWGYPGLSNLSKVTSLVSGGVWSETQSVCSVNHYTIWRPLLQILKSHFYWCKLRPKWWELLKLKQKELKHFGLIGMFKYQVSKLSRELFSKLEQMYQDRWLGELRTLEPYYSKCSKQQPHWEFMKMQKVRSHS